MMMARARGAGLLLLAALASVLLTGRVVANDLILVLERTAVCGPDAARLDREMEGTLGIWPCSGRHLGITREADGRLTYGPDCSEFYSHDQTGALLIRLIDCDRIGSPQWRPDAEGRIPAGWAGKCLEVSASRNLPVRTVPCAQASPQAWTRAAPESDRWLVPGLMFRDCADVCPEMITVQPGRFLMGASPAEEALAGVPGHQRGFAEPQHAVSIAAPFALGTTEIGGWHWVRCVTEGGCRKDIEGVVVEESINPRERITWHDAQDYVRWLSRRTGRRYRLPSEAEWEYAARANTVTSRPWGDAIGRDQAQCFGCTAEPPAGVSLLKTHDANPFGLHAMLGNVWEWVEDCYRPSYEGAPADGAPVVWDGCTERVIRGGSWIDPPWRVRSAARARFPAGEAFVDIGFRVLREIDAPGVTSPAE